MKTIERLRELEKAATTSRPWNVKDVGEAFRWWRKMGNDSTFTTQDGELAAAVVNALPALLAVVEAQAAEIEAWRAVHAASCNASRIGKIHGGRGALLEEAMKDAHACVAVAKDAMKSTDTALRALEGGAG